jgi:hypothetical protein
MGDAMSVSTLPTILTAQVDFEIYPQWTDELVVLAAGGGVQHWAMTVKWSASIDSANDEPSWACLLDRVSGLQHNLSAHEIQNGIGVLLAKPRDLLYEIGATGEFQRRMAMAVLSQDSEDVGEVDASYLAQLGIFGKVMYSHE